MHALAIYVVNEHMQHLRAEAAPNRAANIGRPSLGDRIAAAMDRLSRSIHPTESPVGSLPALKDYPCRG